MERIEFSPALLSHLVPDPVICTYGGVSMIADLHVTGILHYSHFASPPRHPVLSDLSSLCKMLWFFFLCWNLSVHFPFPVFSSPSYFVIGSDLFAVIFCMYLFMWHGSVHNVCLVALHVTILFQNPDANEETVNISWWQSFKLNNQWGILFQQRVIYGNSNNHCGPLEGSPEFVKDGIVIIKKRWQTFVAVIFCWEENYIKNEDYGECGTSGQRYLEFVFHSPEGTIPCYMWQVMGNLDLETSHVKYNLTRTQGSAADCEPKWLLLPWSGYCSFSKSRTRISWCCKMNV